MQFFVKVSASMWENALMKIGATKDKKVIVKIVLEEGDGDKHYSFMGVANNPIVGEYDPNRDFSFIFGAISLTRFGNEMVDFNIISATAGQWKLLKDIKPKRITNIVVYSIEEIAWKVAEMHNSRNSERLFVLKEQ